MFSVTVFFIYVCGDGDPVGDKFPVWGRGWGETFPREC
jgi:hypothetical protein